MRERHDLRRTGLEVAVVAEGVGMEEVAFDDVRERLDVPVRVERPLGAGHDPVVVEDAQRTDAHLLGIAVAVEAEVPSGVEPAALLAPDRVGLADGDIASRSAHIDLIRFSCIDDPLIGPPPRLGRTRELALDR